MKIVAIADLQGQGPNIEPKLIPDGDILLVAGDLTSWGTIEELREFNKWLGLLKHKHKVIVGGNHDRCLEDGIGKQVFTNAIYLENELVDIEGIKIWGSPVNEMNDIFRFRAFADNQQELCQMIPKGLDILLTHGCPYMILDRVVTGEHVGSRSIAEAVEKTKPKYHIFGHIHESYGRYEDKNTTYLNVATPDECNNLFLNGKLLHDPVEFEL